MQNTSTLNSRPTSLQQQRRAAVCLAPFQRQVRKTRVQFLKALNGLPSELNSHTRGHISKRIGKSSSPRLPLIGEYAPWLAADLFGIKDVRSIQEVSVAWLHLYFFTLTLDDLIDSNTQATNETDYIASCLLLQRGLVNLISLSKNKKLLTVIDSAFHNTAEAAVNELVYRRNRTSHYSKADIETLGRKIGLLPICASAISELFSIYGKKLEYVEQAFEKLATGIQLLDDLTDWEEDLQIGNFTFPLARTLEFSKATSRYIKPTEMTRSERDVVLMSMIQTGAIDETLEYAIHALAKALSSIIAGSENNTNGQLTRRYVEQLLANTKYAKKSIADCRIQLARFPHTGSIVNVSKQQEISRELLKARKALYIVAQKS